MNDTARYATTPEQTRLGTVGQLDDGRHYVRFERRLPHAVDRVWAAITEPAELAKWFPGFKVALEQGGEFDIWFTGESGECEGPAHVHGIVTRCEPPNVLECGSMRFELVRDGDGTQLVFTDILQFGGTRTRTELTNSVLGGWHRFVDQLEDMLNGKAVRFVAAEPDYSVIEVIGRP